MITLCTSDLHLAENPRDAYRLRWFEQLPALAQEHGAARVLVLGDVTEVKEGHRAGLVNTIVDGFAALAEVAQVYVLRGNHDYVAEDVPFFKFLSRVPRVRWINEPMSLRLRGLGSCLLLPHSRNPVAEWAGINMRVDWIFTHQTFEGSDAGGGHKLSGISRSIFPKGASIVSGDVHLPQQLGAVTYVGAPYHVTFGDEYKPRVLLIDEGKMRSVPTKGPQKCLMTVSGRDPLGALDIKHPLMRRGDMIKVRIELPAGAEISRVQARQRAREWAATAGVELQAIQIIAPTTGPAKIAAQARGRAPDSDLVRGYAKKMKKGELTLAAGLKIAEEVA